VETRAITNLTASESLEATPSWAPNGKQIAFARREDDQYDIFVMNADGTQATRLTDLLGDEVSPHWSPDGKRLVFTARYTNDTSVWLISADGTGRNLVASTPGIDITATAWAR
jgi:TolB protein